MILPANKEIGVPPCRSFPHKLFLISPSRMANAPTCHELRVDENPKQIVETDSEEVMRDMKGMGYSFEKLAGSPNVLCKPMP